MMAKLHIVHEKGRGQVANDALKIRDQVFIEEQGIGPDREHDGLDDQRVHYVGYLDEQPVTTARLACEAGGWHIERVATIKAMRGQGLAKELIICIMKDAKDSDVKHVELAAQISAKTFYERLGFKAVGQYFLDAGIEHIRMEYDG